MHAARRFRAAAATLVALAVLAGCAGGSGDDGAPPGAGPDAEVGAGADPVGLIGLWRVHDAEGESDPTWLRLDAPGLDLWRDCGLVTGSWSASGTAMVAAVFGAVGDCGGSAVPEVPWLTSTAAYRSADEGWELLDAAGSVVATLTVDGAPEPIPSVAEAYAEPPEVTAEARAALAPPAALPEGLAAVDAAELEGRWVPASGSGWPAEEPFVEFGADGSWTGSDGCNGAAGRWAVDQGGRLLATEGPMTAIACDGVGVPGAVANAGRAGLDGGTLVLTDAAGEELLRLARD